MAERNNSIIDQRMKITNKQTNREDMFDPETPANQKILSTLNPESKKMYERALKQNSKDFSGEMKNTITEITDVAALFGGFFSAGAGVIKAGTLVAKVPLIINSLGESVTGMYNSTVAEINTSAAFSESYLSKHNKTN